jgi:uncharacterized surface protein with fasciclin (FAS1) repeats
MLRNAACLALLLLTASTSTVAQTGPPASPSNSSCPPFISNYTSGVADLNIFTSFLRTYEAVGLDTHPSSGFSLFAPTDRAWNRIEQTLTTSVGGTSNNVTEQEADMLLTIGLYHLTSRARSPAAFLARGSEQTVLGDLTGYNISLYFTKPDNQTQVEGIPFGNSAPLTAPTRVCQTTLYTIDEVMQPTNSLADIPGFQDLISTAQAPASAPVPVGSFFDLPLSPGPGIAVTTTGPGSTNSSSAATDINGDNVAASSAAPATVNSTAAAPAPAPQAAARMLSRSSWHSALIVTAAMLIVGAVSL